MSDQEFFDAVDKIIQLANELNKKMPITRVSAIMKYANARYNAFNFYETDGKTENIEKAKDYYCEQYCKMLTENLLDLKDKAT
jgi:hypothetical protein